MDSPMKDPFEGHMQEWRALSRTPPGVIRRELLHDALAETAAGLDRGARVLDAGCGLAETAALWLQRGCRLVLCDTSAAMIRQAVQDLAFDRDEAGDAIEIAEGRAEDLGRRFAPSSFDLVLCHTLLEYVDRPEELVASFRSLLRPGGRLSCLVFNRHSEAWRRAVLGHDPAAAAAALESRDFSADLFEGVRRRGFSRAEVEEMIEDARLEVREVRGVRIFCDLYPPAALEGESYFRSALELERLAMDRDPFRGMGRYLHFIAVRKERG